MAVPAYPVTSHLANPGNLPSFALKYAAANSNGKAITVGSNSDLATAIKGAVAGSIDAINIGPVAVNLAAYQNTIHTASFARTADNPLHIGTLTPTQTFIGASDSADNLGNQWNLGSSTQPVAHVYFYDLYFRNAFRSTTNAQLFNIQNYDSIRFYGCKWDGCGYGVENPIISARHIGTGLYFVNNLFYRQKGISVRVEEWDGNCRTTAVSRSGTVATYTWNSNDDPQGVIQAGSNGQTVRILGWNEDEFNLDNWEVYNVVRAGAASTFQATVANSGPTSGTFQNAGWNRATVLLYRHRIPVDTVIEYCGYKDIGPGQSTSSVDALMGFQAGLSRHHNCQSLGNTRWSNNWDQGCTMKRLVMVKADDLIVRDSCGISTSPVDWRRGKRGKYYNIVKPNAGVAFRDDDIEGWNFVNSGIDVPKSGVIDDKKNGVAEVTGYYPDCDGLSIRRFTLTGLAGPNVDFGYPEGVDGVVTDIHVTNADVHDGVLQATSGIAFDSNGEDSGDYSTDSVDIDGLHFAQTTGSYTGSNPTSGTVTLLGGIKPTGSTTTDITAGAEHDYTGEFDLMGNADPDCKGAVDDYTPTYVYENAWAGTAGTAASGTTPETDDTGGTLNALGNGLLTNGSGALVSTAAGDGIIINHSQQNCAFENIINAGGANNRWAFYIGTNSSRTTGFIFEVSPNEGRADYYLASSPSTAIWTITGLPITGTQDVTVRIAKNGDNYTPEVQGRPCASVTIANSVDTFVAAVQSIRISAGSTLLDTKIETDTTPGGSPQVWEEIFHVTLGYNSYDGDATSYVFDPVNEVGDGFTTFDTTVQYLRVKSGTIYSNTNGDSSRVSDSLDIDSGITVEPNFRVRVYFEAISTTSGASDNAVVIGGNAADTSNYPALRIVSSSMGLWFKESGTPSLQQPADTISLTASSYVEFEHLNGVYTWRLDGSDINSFDDSSSPTFTDSGKFFLGFGNLLIATDDALSTWRVTEIVVWHLVGDPDAPVENAPVFTVPPVDYPGPDNLLTQFAINAAGKAYETVWCDATDLTLDETGVDYVIAGQDPSGVTTKSDSDTSVSADTLTDMNIADLDEIGPQANVKTPAKVKRGFTATSSGDVKQAFPRQATVILEPPDDQNAVELTSTPTGALLALFPDAVSGTVIWCDKVDSLGNTVTVLPDGTILHDPQGQAVTYSLDAWIDFTTGWAGEETVATEAASQSYTITVQDVISSGSPVDGVDVACTFFPGGSVGALAGITPIDLLGTFTAGVLTITDVPTNTTGHLIYVDVATGTRYGIDNVTPA